MIRDCTILCCRTGERHYHDKSMNEQYEMSTVAPQVCLELNFYFSSRKFLIAQIKMEISNKQTVSLMFSTFFIV